MTDNLPRIQILPKTLINQIAAGEVIVRPASVAKELIENAIDADSTQITIEVSENVRDLTITDDGCGMTPEEAPLALQRHATSKIASLDDIIHVQTRGFRGEALASIAAVSRLTLVTRTPDSLSGFRLEIEGGETLKTQTVGAPIGTSVVVRDIFFNTPARLKFMRRPQTEFKRLLQLVTAQALSHPEIGFTVTRKKKKILELPVKQSLGDRLRQVLGSSVEGMLLELDSGSLPVTIHGFVAKPEAARKDRSAQFFFVNRRPISNRLLTVTFEQAFQGIMMTRRFPVGAVFVFVEPEDVDVNVHPTKEEVRFQDEKKVGGILYRVVSDALRKANLVPYTRLPEESTSVQPEQTSKMPGLFSSPGDALKQSMLGKKSRPGSQIDLGLYEKTKPDTSGLKPGAYKPRLPVKEPLPETEPQEQQAPLPREAKDFLNSLELAEPIGQIDNVYIVAGYPGGIVLIDQHAAHERLLYNKINAREHASAAQRLLLPINFEVEISRVSDLQEMAKQLESFGIELEHFGGQSFVIHTLPADLSDIDAAALVRDLLDIGEDFIKQKAKPDIQDEIAKRLACHGAIRAGQKLSREEMQRLIADLRKTPLAFTCPHGRPTMILLTRSQLDRQFKRTP